MTDSSRTNTTSDVQQRIATITNTHAGTADNQQATDVEQAVALARALQTRAAELQTPQERRQQAELDRMIHNPSDKVTLMQMTDQAFRSARARRSAEQLIHILDVQGIPRFFDTWDRTLLKGFQSFGSYLPGVAVPFVKEKMQHETANVILPAEGEHLREHLRARWEEGVRMNVNYLGEALLGEVDAERRLQNYLAALQRPELEVISVKISTIYSQISPLARKHTIGILCDRMELLYRAAAKATFRRHDGTVVPKFVYLDMEEYRDKELTAEVFMRTLQRPGLEAARAGIALQAYIPDSFPTQKQINEWARRRLEAGGAPVTIRLVKGANMEMERVEASIKGWPQAPYVTKLETDANYNRMLHEGMQPENLAAVYLGIASHNLFTLAFAIVLATRQGAFDRVQFEMLEGMANHQRRALFELVRNLLLYAPACRQEDFTSAIGYLVRRLDENTGPDNFLRHAFNITVDSPTWQRLEQQFVASVAAMETVSDAPRRKQQRSQGQDSGGTVLGSAVGNSSRQTLNPESSSPILNPESRRLPLNLESWPLFTNEPDTDWSLVQNSEWALSILETWQSKCDGRATQVPLVVAGETYFDERQRASSFDPSRPGVAVARCHLAAEGDVWRAIDTAERDASDWRRQPVEQRRETLYRAADELLTARGDLMGAMLAEGGKALTESDPEVSEAIDFCRFYADAAEYFHRLNGLSASGKGTVVVIPPWNFPLAIPCGGVAAALAAGNTVILKPAPETPLIAYLLCRCYWQAGVPLTALQFMPCENSVAQQLATHDGASAVVFTGGTATAGHLLAAKPTIHLLAETGGKNATIVTALSDRDQAIKNILHSAFSHSGQKCSATSLLLLEDEVYHDDKFRAAFCDAVESLHVGSAWKLPTKIGPLIRPPSGKLEQALKELENGESWAVRPQLHVDDNPQLVSPGVKWGAQPMSLTHCKEFFGPVLGVMRFGELHEAIEIVNATGYGLTSGLESLDDREQYIWRRGIRAGNLYINRPTTGAIVLRQPFGGMGKSAVGPGIKAGGPNYVVPLMNLLDEGLAVNSRETEQGGQRPAQSTLKLDIVAAMDEFTAALHDATDFDQQEIRRVLAAIRSYTYWAEEEFSLQHDHFRLLGEDNFRSYLPLRALRVRVNAEDSHFDIFARAAAARVACCLTTVSVPPGLPSEIALAVQRLDAWTDPWAGAIEFLEETDEQLAEAIRIGHTDRVRYAAPHRVPPPVREAAAESLQYIADTAVSAHGRVELLWYMQEQSVSHVYHRYGNLGGRASEDRANPT